jgi:hypothetical protein
MSNALAVCGLQCFRDLDGQADSLFGRKRAFAQPGLERLAFHELHDQGGDIAGLFQSVDDRDVGVIQRGEDLGLTPETDHVARVAGESRGQHLDSDIAPEFGVLRSIDFAHPTGADRSGDLVGANARADGERHCLIL